MYIVFELKQGLAKEIYRGSFRKLHDLMDYRHKNPSKKFQVFSTITQKWTDIFEKSVNEKFPK